GSRSFLRGLRGRALLSPLPPPRPLRRVGDETLERLPRDRKAALGEEGGDLRQGVSLLLRGADGRQEASHRLRLRHLLGFVRRPAGCSRGARRATPVRGTALGVCSRLLARVELRSFRRPSFYLLVCSRSWISAPRGRARLRSSPFSSLRQETT